MEIKLRVCKFNKMVSTRNILM